MTRPQSAEVPSPQARGAVRGARWAGPDVVAGPPGPSAAEREGAVLSCPGAVGRRGAGPVGGGHCVDPVCEVDVRGGELVPGVVDGGPEPDQDPAQAVAGTVSDQPLDVRDVRDRRDAAVVAGAVRAGGLVPSRRRPVSSAGAAVISSSRGDVSPSGTGGSPPSLSPGPRRGPARPGRPPPSHHALQDGRLPPHPGGPGLHRDRCDPAGDLHRLLRPRAVEGKPADHGGPLRGRPRPTILLPGESTRDSASGMSHNVGLSGSGSGVSPGSTAWRSQWNAQERPRPSPPTSPFSSAPRKRELRRTEPSAGSRRSPTRLTPVVRRPRTGQRPGKDRRVRPPTSAPAPPG